MAKDIIRVKGFLRAQITDKDGRIVGDSGWRRNTVTTNGLNNACAAASMGVAGSYQVGYAAIGNGTSAINASQTDLGTRQNSFNSVSVSTIATGTAQATCSFAGSANSATITVSEAGLFKSNSAGSMIAAQTFTGSQMTTAQNFNLTYQLRFS